VEILRKGSITNTILFNPCCKYNYTNAFRNNVVYCTKETYFFKGYDINNCHLDGMVHVVRRLHTNSRNLPKAVSSLEKVGEV